MYSAPYYYYYFYYYYEFFAVWEHSLPNTEPVEGAEQAQREVWGCLSWAGETRQPKLPQFPEMPHFLNFPCWEHSTWSGDSRGVWGQTTPPRKISFVPGYVFWKIWRKEGRGCSGVWWEFPALGLGAEPFWAARISLGRVFPSRFTRISLGRVFSSSFTLVLVSFPLAGMRENQVRCPLSPQERCSEMEKGLEQLNCGHGGAPRKPPGLWRALGHGEQPRRHPRMCWDNIWGWRKAGGGDRHRVRVLLREGTA